MKHSPVMVLPHLSPLNLLIISERSWWMYFYPSVFEVFGFKRYVISESVDVLETFQKGTFVTEFYSIKQHAFFKINLLFIFIFGCVGSLLLCVGFLWSW